MSTTFPLGRLSYSTKCEFTDKLKRYIMTDMTLAISDTRPGLAKIFVDDPPMKRMGDRTDLKGAAVYLLSDASAYMTGGELLITGGLHAGLYEEVA